MDLYVYEIRAIFAMTLTHRAALCQRRLPEFYDPTYEYFKGLGIEEIL